MPQYGGFARVSHRERESIVALVVLGTLMITSVSCGRGEGREVKGGGGSVVQGEVGMVRGRRSYKGLS